MGNPASASCDTNNGCGDEASLLQIGVGAGQEKLGQLTDGAGMQGRSAMLQYGDDMLRLMTKKYGNASGNIDQTDKDMLTDIIGIINETMYASITTKELVSVPVIPQSLLSHRIRPRFPSLLPPRRPPH